MAASQQERLWHKWAAIGGVTAFALILYWLTSAPGLTWAHFGADGGELLAAAVSNGVPHPPGYPLYILLLQGWLALTRWLDPGGDLAAHGNLFSCGCAALAAGVTVRVAARLLADTPRRWLWAALAGLAWTIAPLPWGQSIITEVYALHMLVVALLGWAVLVHTEQVEWLGLLVALGIANHLTVVLLLPAIFYYSWFAQSRTWQRLIQVGGTMMLGVLLGLAFYARIPLVAAAQPPPPINWGYADQWEGFWWLISGSAYQGYLFGAPPSTILQRVAAWANTLTTQFTPVGLALALLGLSAWDRHRGHLRNFSLFWLIPVSLYAINYYTRDSEIYLLPVIWLATLWLAVGLASLVAWLTTEGVLLFDRLLGTKAAAHQPKGAPTIVLGQWLTGAVALVCISGLALLLVWRLPDISVRNDMTARQFIAGALAELTPGCIIISSGDAETFALWYAAWGSGELYAKAPNAILINYALYQFPWYRRLVAALYPEIVGQSTSVEEILARNYDQHAIFFSEHFSFWPDAQMEPAGPIWRYVAGQ
ncbi:MAG: DUF2723 domain-containing protein [Caldilineaceae bacterium]